jgi:addiction module RelE/StbE family toxin
VSDAWRVVLTPQAKRDLNRLPAKAVPAVVEGVLSLRDNPVCQGKPLNGELEGLHSARRAPYRIVYRIERQSRVVRLLLIGHRADVYRPR